MFEESGGMPGVARGLENMAAEVTQRTETAESAGLVARMAVCARAEAQAAAEQFVVIGELFAYRLAQSWSETENFAIDTMAAVAAEVAAGLRISQGLAMSKLRYARAMRERLPQTAAVFCAGEIDFSAFATIVYRTDLIEDPQVLARVDELIAANVGRWPSLSRDRLSGRLDTLVSRVDADAVRRRTQRRQDREVTIWDDAAGISRIDATLDTPDAHALDRCLDALAATVCPHDPRTRDQRRADGFAALVAGAERLGCRCGRPDCTAPTRPGVSPVVIHVIADQSALHGTPSTGTGAWEVGADGLITPELIRELAGTARQVPLIHPGITAPEPQHIPSTALADFVRCRDLTCRWPGCDVPAQSCDVDREDWGVTRGGGLTLISIGTGWSSLCGSVGPAAGDA